MRDKSFHKNLTVLVPVNPLRNSVCFSNMFMYFRYAEKQLKLLRIKKEKHDVEMVCEKLLHGRLKHAELVRKLVLIINIK